MYITDSAWGPIHNPDGKGRTQASPPQCTCARGERGVADFAGKSFDPETLKILETAFDEAWAFVLKSGAETVSRETLAQCVLEAAEEGERDPQRLREAALTLLASRRS
jgi:hypothetical protein